MLLLKSLSEDLLGCGWYVFSLPCYCLGSLHLVWNVYVTSGLLWSFWAEAKKFLITCNCLQLQSPGTIDLGQCWWLATLKKLPSGVGLFLFECIGCGRGLLWLRQKRESFLHLFRGGPRVFGPYQTAWKVSRHHLWGLREAEPYFCQKHGNCHRDFWVLQWKFRKGAGQCEVLVCPHFMKTQEYSAHSLVPHGKFSCC